MNANPVDKEKMAEDLAPLRALFGKSVVAKVDLPEGTLLKREHLTLKKPGSGIPAPELESILNCRVKKSIAANSLLNRDDLE
jgi:N-acetylneuraminate synthase